MVGTLATLASALLSFTIAGAHKFGPEPSTPLPLPSPSAFCAAFNSVQERMGSRMNLSRMSSALKQSEVDAPSIASLFQRAQQVRGNMYGENNLPSFISDASQLSYPASKYNMEVDNSIRNRNKKKVVQRGYCNWLIPKTIMIGQYPGMTPETNGPSSKECQMHIQNMVQDASISLFCCLQTEVPSQEDDFGWKRGEVYLEPEYVRREFPRPFTRYGPMAQSFADEQISFLHNPIEDLSVPTCNNSLLSLLSELLQHLEGNESTIYLHCWGGRGRAGLIGSCLASLLFPELSSTQILQWVQMGYDTRAGAEAMREGLKRSPQTEQQRMFVREFVNIVHAERDGE